MQHRYLELRLPVAIIAGTADRVVHHQSHAEWLHRKIPQSSLRLLPEIGHMVHYTTPGEVIEAIEIAGGRKAA